MGLILNGIEFYIDELPEEINFGGDQVLAVRKFPGGGMDIQALGAFDDPISWEGTFMFQEALKRCEQIGKLRISAQPVELSVSSIKRTVIVSRFVYRYRNDYYIPYEITLQPVINCSINGNMQSQQTSSISGQTVSSNQKNVINTHTVLSNDTLYKLAVKYYKDGSKWVNIAQANNIKDPKTLQIGKNLIIPNLA